MIAQKNRILNINPELCAGGYFFRFNKNNSPKIMTISMITSNFRLKNIPITAKTATVVNGIIRNNSCLFNRFPPIPELFNSIWQVTLKFNKIKLAESKFNSHYTLFSMKINKVEHNITGTLSTPLKKSIWKSYF